MNTTIESARAIVDTEHTGSMESAVEAGNRCLDDSDLDRADVDLLINLGVYRDENIVEPSIAALLQQRLELNLDPMAGDEPFRLDGPNTFSFDLMNGPCGFLQAAEVVSSLLATGQNNAALLLASDAHPRNGDGAHEDFPYTPSASAAILTPSADADSGFRAFGVTTPTDGGDPVTASHTFGESDHPVDVRVDVPDGFIEDLRAEMVGRVDDFLESEGIDPESLDGLVVSEPASGFAASVADAVGAPEDAAVSTFEEYGDTLSSSLLFGYAEGAFDPGDQVLFVAGGADRTVACAHYVA